METILTFIIVGDPHSAIHLNLFQDSQVRLKYFCLAAKTNAEMISHSKKIPGCYHRYVENAEIELILQGL